jgi:hypothetical protein
VVPPWELSKPSTYPECTSRDPLSAETDIVYRTCYRACAGGPFTYPKYPGFIPVAKSLGSSQQRRIQVWENDGIVNTASMLWPNGAETRLVPGDHMDIVGHYTRVRASSPDEGRGYQAYDLLKSGTAFEDTFEQVWNDVFEFCVS